MRHPPSRVVVLGPLSLASSGALGPLRPSMARTPSLSRSAAFKSWGWFPNLPVSGGSNVAAGPRRHQGRIGLSANHSLPFFRGLGLPHRGSPFEQEHQLVDEKGGAGRGAPPPLSLVQVLLAILFVLFTDHTYVSTDKNFRNTVVPLMLSPPTDIRLYTNDWWRCCIIGTTSSHKDP